MCWIPLFQIVFQTTDVFQYALHTVRGAGQYVLMEGKEYNFDGFSYTGSTVYQLRVTSVLLHTR